MGETPYISVVIPTYNREDTVHRCLSSLQDVEYPEDRYEVIVADDGSTDATVDIARGMEDIEVLEHENTGPAGARNRGIEAANIDSDIILFLDGDTSADRTLLEEHAAAHRERDEEVIVSGSVNALEDEAGFRARLLEYSGYFKMKGGEENSLDWAASNNLSFPAELARELKFDEDYTAAAGEDQDICIRATGEGYQIVQHDAAKAYHPRDKTITAGLSRGFKYGKGDSTLVHKHPGKTMLSPRMMGRLLMYSAVLYTVSSAMTGFQDPLTSVLQLLGIAGIESFLVFMDMLYDKEAYDQGLLFLLPLSAVRYLLMESHMLGKILTDVRKARATVLREMKPSEMFDFSDGLYANRFLKDLIAIAVALLVI